MRVEKIRVKTQRTRQLGPDERRVGIESLEPQNKFWGVDLSDDFESKRLASAHDRPAPGAQSLRCDYLLRPFA